MLPSRFAEPAGTQRQLGEETRLRNRFDRNSCLLTGSNSRTRGVRWKRRRRWRLRERSPLRGRPASVENERPKSRTRCEAGFAQESRCPRIAQSTVGSRRAPPHAGRGRSPRCLPARLVPGSPARSGVYVRTWIRYAAVWGPTRGRATGRRNGLKDVECWYGSQNREDRPSSFAKGNGASPCSTLAEARHRQATTTSRYERLLAASMAGNSFSRLTRHRSRNRPGARGWADPSS